MVFRVQDDVPELLCCSVGTCAVSARTVRLSRIGRLTTQKYSKRLVLPSTELPRLLQIEAPMCLLRPTKTLLAGTTRLPVHLQLLAQGVVSPRSARRVTAQRGGLPEAELGAQR